MVATKAAFPTIRQRYSAFYEHPQPSTMDLRKMKEIKGSLDMTVLGMCSGAALDGVSCTLIRYKQQSPDEPLRMVILKARTGTLSIKSGSTTYRLRSTKRSK